MARDFIAHPPTDLEAWCMQNPCEAAQRIERLTEAATRAIELAEQMFNAVKLSAEALEKMIDRAQ